VTARLPTLDVPPTDKVLAELVGQATWHRRWRLGEVFVAVGELDGGACCLESLPENALVDAVPGCGPAGLGQRGPALAELLAASGTTAFYGRLPGRRRLADVIVDPAADRERTAAAAAQAGRQLARLHAAPAPAGPGVPPYLALLRAELRAPRLAAYRSALAAAPGVVREHLRPLLEPSEPQRAGEALLHASFGPGAVFVGANGQSLEIALTRWTGAVGGDPMYDLGTFLGPLVELTAEQAALTVPRRFASRLAHGLLAGYTAERGRALSADERARMWSRTVLNLALHLCYFTARSGRVGDPQPYVAGISAVVAAGVDTVLDGAFAAGGRP
jgi:Phosphotransferase enzyme family